jgi:hypothetical protein
VRKGSTHPEVVGNHDEGGDQRTEFNGHFDGVTILFLIASAVYSGRVVRVTRRAL